MKDLQEGIPLHKQISDWLRTQIEAGSFASNQKLPSESELSDKFNVSRVTIRHALQTLESDQVIYRCQGVGSFVNGDCARHSLMHMNDFMEEMEASGIKGSSKVISLEQIQVPDKIATILQVKEGAVVVKLDRIRFGDGKPFAYDETWLPMFYGHLLEGYDLTNTTIYRILEEDFDIPILKGCYRLEAECATSKIAEYLQVPEQSALMLINRISFTLGEKPIYYQKRYHRSDKVIYQFNVERNKTGYGYRGETPLNDFGPVFEK